MGADWANAGVAMSASATVTNPVLSIDPPKLVVSLPLRTPPLKDGTNLQRRSLWIAIENPIGREGAMWVATR